MLKITSFELRLLQQQCLHCMQHAGNWVFSLQLTMKPKRKVRWMVIATGKKSGCRCEYTGSILINTPIYMVSDTRHSTLVFAEAELLLSLTHSFSPQKEQHIGGPLSEQGWFVQTHMATPFVPGHLKTCSSWKLQIHPMAQDKLTTLP